MTDFGALRVVVVLVGFAVTAIGCGGGDGQSCGAFTACGGNVVGTWNAGGVCMTGNVLGDECPGATTDTSGLSITGTWTLNADSTYTQQGALGGMISVSFAPSCFTEEGFTPTCDQINAGFAMLAMTDPEFPFSAASCAAAGSNCRCSMTLRPIPTNETGTYATSGSVITTTPAGGTAEAQDYCVSGNRLQIQSRSMMNSGMMDFVGTISFTKR